MPLSGTGERVTPALDFPSRDGLSVQAIRVDYEPPGAQHPVPPEDGGNVTASPVAFFVLDDAERATVYDRV
jgi:hypothetical protein